jgi:hypothetical protein
MLFSSARQARISRCFVIDSWLKFATMRAMAVATTPSDRHAVRTREEVGRGHG